ncbi:YjiH family protein [Paenibacillus albiflavus]|nr:YjiH family protein [Paenibacillus albiflavus]
MNATKTKRHNSFYLMLFIIPSLFGILLFMTPIKWDGQVTIPIALLSKSVQSYLSESIPYIMTVLITIAALGSIFYKLWKPAFLSKNRYIHSLLDVAPVWVAARVMGSIFAYCVLFQLGPEWIWSSNTGGMLLFELLPVLFAVFLFAGLFLPLLLNFGLLEFCGAITTKIMRPLFKLPGRSSIDCMTSWLGDGTVGVLLTNKQYEEGFYTKREAAVIGTTFSAVSITFSLVVLSTVNLAHMFVPFYLTVLFSGIIAAIIMPRIPPLSRKSDQYYVPNNEAVSEVIPKNQNSFQWGLSQAVKRAEKSADAKSLIQEGMHNVLDLWIGVAPIVMAVGTLALIIAETTPIFQWLGIPFVPLLELMHVPEAAAASQTLVIGFADMFLPTVLASSIESELTRFVIACVSVTQLIYLSEVGGLLLGSKIPVSFKDLAYIFILRTLITLPIIVLIAHLLF